MQGLVAYAQSVNAQTSAVRKKPIRRIAKFMQPEQKIIADWMRRQLTRKGWTAEEWARRAGVSTSTVSRAQSVDYPSVTAVLTLDKLARAAGVPSILSYIEADTPPVLPNEAVLSAIFAGMLRGMADRFGHDDQAQLMAQGLAASLDLLARNPAIAESAPALTATAEALTMRQHPPGTNT
jgi:transcriptional regulator with XRE-family HTH domain